MQRLSLRSSCNPVYIRTLYSLYTQQQCLHGSQALSVQYRTDCHRTKYINVTSHGSTYNVGYLDEGPPDGRPVLTLHGAPGAAEDYDFMITELVEKGIRVIAPNLPGTPLTKQEGRTSTYNGSSASRSQFVQDFMKVLNVSSLDMLVGHSLAGTAVMHLAANTDKVKSIAMLNTAGHHVHRGIKPLIPLQMYSKGLELPVLGFLLRLPLRYLYQRRGFRVDDIELLVSSLAVAARLGFNKMKVNTEKLQAKGIPALFATCQNEVLIEWQITLASAMLAGVSDDHVSFLDSEEKLVGGPSADAVLPSRVLVFATGRHQAHRSHPNIVTKCVLDLLEHVR